ncbi:hypothetical protein [Chryseobacterium sp.]|uniref:hypothetical protein n=1 Tax=Chryseobacterium sp. TaxID=1871047 RepID=UPI00388F9977
MIKQITIFVLHFCSIFIYSQTDVKAELEKINNDYEIENALLLKKNIKNNAIEKIKKSLEFQVTDKNRNAHEIEDEEKIIQEKYKNLYRLLILKIEKENPIIGPKKISEVNLPTNANQTMIEAYQEISLEVKSRIISSYFKKKNENKQTLLTFKVDSDGKIKNIVGQGNDEEFTNYAILLLYSLNKRLKPIEKKGEYIVQKYNLPIKLIFN